MLWERRLLACSLRQLAGRLSRTIAALRYFRQAAENCRLAAYAPQNCEDVAFGFIPVIRGLNALFSRRWVVVGSATPLRLESADHGPGAGRDSAGFPPANKAVRVR
jgi:hypothetical protein